MLALDGTPVPATSSCPAVRQALLAAGIRFRYHVLAVLLICDFDLATAQQRLEARGVPGEAASAAVTDAMEWCRFNL